MIHIERSLTTPPALEEPYSNRVKPPKIKGKSESATVIARIEQHRAEEAAAAPDTNIAPFSFPYERYKATPVVAELAKLFHGKCAYCESRYAVTQPMDVEHWRPKGEVHDEGKVFKPGYYWLAAEWTNLLPSCIDCNRERNQFDMVEKTDITLGKQNQFPLARAQSRVMAHEDDPGRSGGSEEVLLLNPCVDDPELFLQYDGVGVVHPLSDDPDSLEWKRAMASIRVYALNRSELVSERRALINRIDHRILVIDELGKIRDSLTGNNLASEADTVNDLIAKEIDELLALRDPERPYAAVARQLVAETTALLQP